MALTFGFYDSVNGDRTYNAKDFSRFFDGILTDGIFGDIGDALRVTAGSGLSVNVGIGRAWFNRTWTWNDSVLNIPLPTADPVLPRIDTVALIIDDILRTNSIEIIQGTASSSPAAPTLTNTSDHHEYRLADVAIAATATSITNNDITDFVGTAQTPYTNVMGSILFFQNATMPVMDGQASIGVKKEYARSDHRHPTDTSRAPIQSPEFTGTPKAPTAAAGTNTTQIATTAFVKTAIDNSKSSMALSGTPTAPTAAAGTNTTQIATTAFVKTAIDNAIASKANLASPTFTGTPKAPTAAAGTNTTQIATTEFVHANARNIIYSATCSTATNTLTKVATITGSAVGFGLTKGTMVAVTFDNAEETGSVTYLNVNGKGAKAIQSHAGATAWAANETVIFTYTGSNWRMGASGYQAALGYLLSTNSVPAGTVFAGPSSGSSTPSFRFLSYNDIASGDSPENSLIMSGGSSGSRLSYRAIFPLSSTSGKIPASGGIAESSQVAGSDNRILTAGSLLRMAGHLVPRDTGMSASTTCWRLIRMYSADYFNNSSYNPSIQGMIHFYWQ